MIGGGYAGYTESNYLEWSQANPWDFNIFTLSWKLVVKRDILYQDLIRFFKKSI